MKEKENASQEMSSQKEVEHRSLCQKINDLQAALKSKEKQFDELKLQHDKEIKTLR